MPNSDIATKFDKSSIDNARIGIALGSGSARGWSHIGVLQELAEMGIEPHVVAGSSVGALIGAAYANNQLDEIEAMVTALEWKDVIAYLDMSIMSGGLIQGDKIVKFFRKFANNTEIESLPHRFAAVATDLDTGSEVWLQKGDLLDAVRASVALPGLFTPCRQNGRWLVDGGLVDPVPVSLCRAMGAEIVIAVSLNSDIVGKHVRYNHSHHHSLLSDTNSTKTEPALWDRISDQLGKTMQEQKSLLLARLFGESQDAPGVVDVLAGSINIMQDRITRSRMAGDPPDIVLSPKLSQLGLMEFDRGAMAIEEGRASVDRMRSALEYVVLNR